MHVGVAGIHRWSAVTVLLVAVMGTVAARSDDGPLVFEDRTKHISFVPPAGWLCDAASDANALVFVGPKVYGVTSKLTIRNNLAGGRLEQIVQETLAQAVGNADASAATTGEAVELPAGSVISRAVSALHSGKGPALRLLVAAGRDGPFATTFIVEIADKDYERARPELIKSLASVQWIALDAVYTDALMGLTFFYLPKGFEVDPDKTSMGQSVRWILKGEDGIGYGDLTADLHSDELAGDAAFNAWAETQAKTFERRVKVKSKKTTPFALSECDGQLYEYVLDYYDGKLLNTWWLVYVHGPRGPIAFTTSAESKYFEKLRPGLDQFLRSITIESVDAKR